jgi:Na+/H+-translocating membrane pyrophosphatase
MRALRLGLPLGSIVIIAMGLAVALSAGSWTGWVIVAIGLIDLASIPFVLRAVGARRSRSPANPYARED